MANASTTPTRDPEALPLPPGPDELPVIGSTFDLMRRPIEFVDRVAEYGDVVTYRVAGQRFTAVLHPDRIERVLVSESDRFRRWAGEEWGDTFAGYGSEGLLLTEGEQWRRQRLLIQNAFTPARIESYTDAMVAETERTIEEWDDGETIELTDETSKLTLRILTRALFDLDLEERRTVVRRAADALNARANARSLSAFLPSWVPTPTNRRLHRAMDDLETLLEALIAERRADASDGDDLLSLLLAVETDDGSTLSEREVRDQLITFLFAGHETTALALTYALHALGHHTDTRRRLSEEIASVTGGDPPSVSDLGDLTHTERVVKETLRLYPPAYAIFRQATETTEIGGYRIPDGSKLTLPQIRVHRDRRFYPDPEAFRPERWTEAFEDSLPEYAYFPFGGGPRHCIGMRFAMIELELVLPTVLSAVTVDPVGGPDLAFETGITLQPADPMDAVVHER
ncbi:cytochrome P450 [Natrinema salaciae]|uniref:Cytochrome P450 n=1 Tax=Natrinema salaciae TaxID=1186196 RepID=A0A1H9BE74_9EURY|nr:cytochrome P450 [Natrinema salaciae]SEP87296.1 Cytochrome P450 [Natrinema salaciae]